MPVNIVLDGSINPYDKSPKYITELVAQEQETEEVNIHVNSFGGDAFTGSVFYTTPPNTPNLSLIHI